MARENKDMYDIIKIINRSDIYKSFENVVDYVKDLDDRNESLRKQLNEYNKDNEIQELNEEIKNIQKRVLSYWNDVEKQRSREFQEKHREKCGRSNISYIITGTGIGTCITIRCNKCKEELDITDVDSW